MPKIASNNLTIEPISTEGFRLFGYINGEKIRRKSADLKTLEDLKLELETDAKEKAALIASRPIPQNTYLTTEQLRDAEAAYRLLAGRSHSLVDCVVAATSVLGTGKAKDAVEARNEFIAFQKKRHLSEYTINTNTQRIDLFLKVTKVKLLGEISPQMCDDFVLDNDLDPTSQLSKGRPICTWLNWCCERKQGYLKVSPYQVDMSELKEIADRDLLGKKRMYVAAKCERLLQAAIDTDGGSLVPFTILSLWCYMRAADVKRTTPSLIHLEKVGTDMPHIEAYGHKKGSRARTVDIPMNVVPLLRQCIERGLIPKTGVVFKRYVWDVIREKAGLIKFSPILNKKTKNMKIIESDWQENILRHTGESYARRLKKDRDLKEVTESAGHSITTAYKHYLCNPLPGETEKFYAIMLSFLDALEEEKEQAVA